MLNVSGEAAGRAGGILIRAVEPLEGIGLMKKHRGCTELRDLTAGAAAGRRRFELIAATRGLICARRGYCGWRDRGDRARNGKEGQ